jgi:hypothetical protein
VLYRLAYLHSNYNVNVNVRVIFPIAVRTGSESGANPELSGRWYHFGYSVMDMPRTARYQGIPFRYAQPDPILQDIYPQGDEAGQRRPAGGQGARLRARGVAADLGGLARRSASGRFTSGMP